MGEFVMHRLFPIVCNMSLTASVVILAVLAVRLLLRRAPKVFSYALWAVVLFRLLCPVSVTSAGADDHNICVHNISYLFIWLTILPDGVPAS